ncbi:hypothetical protein IEU95_11910 [Hoyosella rhizosphaerae]|uniref:Histidine kinase n=1 Tax=Hoyosella rhizosphaerae TaxID=1755582 RepID=A0A916U7P3_9ACTN|nr:ATP-binding protein [Hoyosella rhizosphaerae]MBN4927538.1 hypothetical protein [Hoyosella rhizosphaerae]GGC63699.1 histidine kinase [Hoyosella rhizosphaerae]
MWHRQDVREEGSAVARTTRVLGLALGLAGIAFIGIEYAVVSEQMLRNPLWWLIPAVIVVPGMYCAMIVAALRGSARAVRALCGWFPVAYLPVVATIPVAFEYRGLAPIDSPWPLLVGSGTIITASFVLPMRFIVVLATVYAGMHGIAIAWTQFDVTWSWAIRDGVSIAMIGVIFAGVVRSVERNAHLIDQEIDTLRNATMQRARAAAIGQERERVDALIHDTTVSTFVAVNSRAPLAALQESARQSLATLDRLTHEDDSDSYVDAQELTARLRQVVTDISDDISTEIHAEAEASTYPIEVARMLQEVIAEAARNSMRHAGGNARRELRITVLPDSVHVVFSDNGVGFVPDDIPPRRLGIRVGMLGRVAHIPGARITIDSAPGTGTTVSLRWHRHD